MIDTSKRLKLLVVGDKLIDHWHLGSFTRFAPEGGQPIFVERESVIVAGAAANTVRQLEHWNCEVVSFGCACGTKHRYQADSNYFLRVDADCEPSADNRERVMEACLEAIPGFDGVLVSDYDKGTLTDADAKALVLTCKEHRVPCFVDPKHKESSIYEGCTVIKCNKNYATNFLEWTKGAQVIVTDGPRAPTVKCGRELIGYDPRGPVPAVSVVGAGDCFHAALACAYLRDATLKESAEIAYSAGRCYVQHPFNRPVHPLEVCRDLIQIGGKIVSADALAGFLALRRPSLVVSNGVFDLLHPGHVATLAWAKRQGDCLVVAVNGDASAARIKSGRQKRMTCQERMQVVAGLGFVDFVVPFDENTPVEMMQSLGVNGIVVKGADNDAENVPHPPGWKALIAPPSPFTRHASDLT